MDALRARPRTSIGCGVGVAVGCIAIVVAASGSGPRLASAVPMVDVRTGEIRWISVRARAVSVPAEDPDSGERTLIGAERTADGAWRVLPQDMELMAAVGGRISPRIDRETGVVRAEKESDR